MRRLASGKWFEQVYIGKDENGKPIRISFTEPTKELCEYHKAQIKKAHKMKLKEQRKKGLTVGDCIDQYILLSSSTLSPSTLHGYKKIRRTAFQSIMETPVTKISNKDMQEAVNEECERVTDRGKKLSPKTVSNNYALLSAAIKSVSGFTFSVRLPKRVRNIKEYPPADEIYKRIVGTDIELPCLLMMWLSLTVSEVRGLTTNSIRNGSLYVESVVVDGDRRNIRKEQAKTSFRRRRLVLPPYLMQMINVSTPYGNPALRGENAPLIGMDRNTLYRRFKKYTEGLGITLHDLRHINASVMAKLNIPSKYAQERGGWSSPRVYETVYQHTFSKDRLAVDSVIDDYFNSIIEGFV